MSPTSPGWRDAYGNTLEKLIRLAMSDILSVEPSPFRYDPDVYPGCAIREAVRRLEAARQSKVVPPEPASPEDLVHMEIELLIDVYEPSSKPIAKETARYLKECVRAVESRFPGTLAKIEAREPGTLARAGLLSAKVASA